MSAPPADSAVTPSLGQRWRRWRGPLAFLAVLGVLAVVVSLGATGGEPEGDLDPEGVDPDGSRALVRIAEGKGAEVTVARDADAAAEVVDADTQLVVVHGHRLTDEEFQRLAALPGDRLLVEPTTQLLDAAAPGVEVHGRAQEEVLEPGCDLAAAAASGAAAADGETYGAEAAEGTVTECYPSGGGSVLVRVDADGSTVTVLGTGAPLRNAHLADEGNAALALNLLGDKPHVVWLIPDVAVGAGDASLWELLPSGFYLALTQLGAAAVLLVLWRARRMGPLVAERLPVVVQAAETTEGRARLYRSRRAGPRAAAALRSGFLDRVRPAVGLGATAPEPAVAAAVAARCGRDPREVRALLYGAGTASDTAVGADGAAATDTALVRLADELDQLEREVLGGGLHR